MKEGPPNPIESENDDEKEQKKREKLVLALELSESRESFPFPGIDPDFYSKTKEEEREFPDYATPIDELVERCRSEGIKVVLGKNPESGNVYILPSGSDDIENDSIFPRYLQINEMMDERLKELISMDKG